ncbi:MAG: polyamine aminopropyltransferase [bacterium]|nr:polyamine aminopropyltransferase [bacterium]
MGFLNAPETGLGRRAWVLKACVFTTGLAGIVAEYVMATMASYLLGDAVLHWTLIISVMLFAMGLGSRLTRSIRANLADAFVAVELALSALVALSATLVYVASVWIESIGLVIYGLALAIGVLIGMEIPLATRLNEAHEELRINVATVIEKDYYGALLGGVLFAFLALPHLGLTYTPIVLAAVNFAVAVVFYVTFEAVFERRRTLRALAVATPVFLALLAFFAEPITLFGEQQRYRDRVVFSEQTRFQRIVLTRWKDDHWLYLDGKEQFSSYDEERYHEPLVHPALAVAAGRSRVLLLGAGDGLAARDVLEHRQVELVRLVELDPVMTELARTHPVLLELNGGVLDDPRVEVVHGDAYAFLLADDSFYDIIIIDLPDPRTVALARLYSRQFYELAARHLGPGGVLVTQATSPFFSRRAFLSILATVRAAGLVAVPYHNHIPTLGEWGWVLGMKAGEGELDTGGLRHRLSALDFDGLDTRFLNRDAMVGMLHFGKGMLEDSAGVEVSEERDLAVFYYYRDGAWDLY